MLQASDTAEAFAKPTEPIRSAFSCPLRCAMPSYCGSASTMPRWVSSKPQKASSL
jgi:hypothetical protein